MPIRVPSVGIAFREKSPEFFVFIAYGWLLHMSLTFEFCFLKKERDLPASPITYLSITIRRIQKIKDIRIFVTELWPA